MSTRIGNATGQLTATTATTDLVIGGESRTPTGCIVYCSEATVLDSNADDAQLSVGYSDFTNQYTHNMNAEDAQGTSDAAVESNTGLVLVMMDPGTDTIDRSATVTAISGGIRLTPIQSGLQHRVFCTLVFEGECVALNTTDTTLAVDVEYDFAHGLAAKPNFGWVSCVDADFGDGDNHARVSLGVFEDEGSIVVKSVGFNFQHGTGNGENHAYIHTSRIVVFVGKFDADIDFTGECTGNDSTNWSITARTSAIGSPVLGLLVNASDVTAEVVSVNSPTTAGSDWNFNGASVTGQHLTMYTTMIQTEDSSILDSPDAGTIGIYATDGADDFSVNITNENFATTHDTMSRMSSNLHLWEDDNTTVAFEMENFEFTSDGWDVPSGDITTANGTTRKWLGLIISEISGGGDPVPVFAHHFKQLQG